MKTDLPKISCVYWDVTKSIYRKQLFDTWEAAYEYAAGLILEGVTVTLTVTYKGNKTGLIDWNKRR